MRILLEHIGFNFKIFECTYRQDSDSVRLSPVLSFDKLRKVTNSNELNVARRDEGKKDEKKRNIQRHGTR